MSENIFNLPSGKVQSETKDVLQQIANTLGASIDTVIRMSNVEELVSSVIDGEIKGVLNNELVATDIANKLNAKETEYAPKLAEVSAQLAETTQFANTKISNVNEKDFKPVVTFIDDDGNSGVHSRLMPIFKSKNVGFGAALITNRLSMTIEQLKECQNNGVEMLSHCVDVTTNLTDGYTDEQIDYQLRESAKWLKDNGFEYEGCVYPQNTHNLNVRKRVRKYYNYAFGSIGFNDEGFLNHSSIKRIAFGSWTSGNPTVNGNNEKSTLAYYKACVDYAKSNNLWLVFMTHVGQQDISQDSILGELIDYIKSVNVDILKPSEAFKIKANKLSVGDTEEGYLYFGEKKIATNITASKYISHIGITKDTPITFFEKNVLSITNILATDNAQFPVDGGVLHTYRASRWDGLSYQDLISYVDGKIYRRIWNVTNSVWNSFIDMTSGTSPIVTLTFNSVDANTPSSSFENNKITYCIITTAGAATFPEATAGVFIFDKTISSNGYCWQKYIVYNSDRKYERIVKSDGTYGDWRLVDGYNQITFQQSEIVINANTTVNIKFDFVGIKANTTHISGNPTWGLPSGLLYNIFVEENDKVTIRIANISSNNITLTARKWKFSYII